ncbi:MAG: HAMP domain-containing histidine kinase, partial [Chloroflexi bacterium]|nr:HAMP domain-containing histidine kinase [Chloroflexota bacterium]
MAALLTAISVLCVARGPSDYSLAQAVAPLGLLWATALTSGLSARNLYTALQWALDSQSQAWKTAREVQERRAELRRALDSLTITHGILERTTHELEAARREAEEARQVKSRFVANISHELRTPLNIIVGFAEMLCMSPEVYEGASWPPILREDLLTIWRNAEHLLNMIDDVLDLAQIEATRLPILPQPTDVIELVRDTLAAAGPLFRDSGLELRVRLPSLSVMANVDQTRIRQVLLNLINNAVRYTPQGFVEVGATVEDGKVTVYVRDSGVGIPEDKLETVFQEFERVDTSMKRVSGAGLGLAIARHVVRLHGGHIGVQSRLGEGSTFFFSLPIQDEGGPGEPSLRRTARPLRRDDRRAKVAVFAEDGLVVRILQRHMEHHEVLTADSVPLADPLSEAVKMVREEHPEVAVVAASSERELERALQRADALLDAVYPFDLPVVVCAFPTERRAGAALGVDDLLIKPVVREEVVASISTLVARPERLLIVDDEADMVRLLSRIVRQA